MNSADMQHQPNCELIVRFAGEKKIVILVRVLELIGPGTQLLWQYVSGFDSQVMPQLYKPEELTNLHALRETLTDGTRSPSDHSWFCGGMCVLDSNCAHSLLCFPGCWEQTQEWEKCYHSNHTPSCEFTEFMRPRAKVIGFDCALMH